MTVSDPAPSLPPPRGWMPSTRTSLIFLVLLALVTRIAFLMHSVDEPLSAQLALGVRDFRLAQQQPPAPGHFFHVKLAQAVNRFTHDELTALSLVSALFSTLALLPLFYTLRTIFRGNGRLALTGTTLTAFCYGFWLTGVRPVNDPAASFFVLATVCALLLGLERTGWFYAGAVLFGLTLGFQEYAAYFLTPFVLVAACLVLRRRGPGVVATGLGGWLVAMLAWLAPSVRNAGGWSTYQTLWQHAQRGTYTAVNFAEHLSRARLVTQAWHDYVQIWGNWLLAVPMLLAALVGVVSLWKAGTAGRLFLLFGVTTLLHVFFAPGRPVSRYYIYTAPLLCTAVVGGVYLLSGQVGGSERTAVWNPTAFVGIIGLLVLASLAVTLPSAARVKTFLSPEQAAYEYLWNRHGGKLRGVDLFATDPTSSSALSYYRNKSGLNYADGYDAAQAAPVLPLLGGNEPFYVLADTRVEDGGDHLQILDNFWWEPSLRNVLQCTPAVPTRRNLSLYELKHGPPDEYTLRGGRLQPVLFDRDVAADGWAGPAVELYLPHDGSSGAVVQLEGTIPAEFGFYFPFKIEYKLPRGGRAGDFTVEKPGLFHAVLALEDLPAEPLVDLQLFPAEYCIPVQTVPGSTDPRRLSLLINRLETTSGEHPWRMKYAGGWYNPESDKGGTWRWCGSEGEVEMVVGHSGTLLLAGDYISIPEDNKVDVLLDGRVVATADTPAKTWSATQTLRVPVAVGVHRLTFRSRQPAAPPSPGDTRSLAFGVRNLVPNLE